MDKESIIALQEIDCNCNDCKFMIRDFIAYQYWEEWNKSLQFAKFESERIRALKIAKDCQNEQGKATLLSIADKMKFQFNRDGLLQYGNCIKLNKPVSFIPGTCQIDTQHCFEHRKK